VKGPRETERERVDYSEMIAAQLKEITYVRNQAKKRSPPERKLTHKRGTAQFGTGLEKGTKFFGNEPNIRN
jgi:hypothetical protein